MAGTAPDAARQLTVVSRTCGRRVNDPTRVLNQEYVRFSRIISSGSHEDASQAYWTFWNLLGDRPNRHRPYRRSSAGHALCSADDCLASPRSTGLGVRVLLTCR